MENSGTHAIPFSREIYIERDDYMENAPSKFFRLSVGKQVRLKSAYIITCTDAIKDANGNVTELHCTYIPESRSGSDTSGLKVKGTVHWVNIADAVPVEVLEYDRLFKVENPASEEGDFKEYINENSLTVVPVAYAEPAIKEAKADEHFQFLRKGYFCLDKTSTSEKLVFNRTVTLKDNWAKEQKK